MESAAALAGVQLQVDWEVSSVPAILDCVAAGIGHAALGEDALQIYERPERLVTTPFARADIQSTLCLVTPTSKRATPLMQRTAAVLMRMVGDGAGPLGKERA